MSQHKRETKAYGILRLRDTWIVSEGTRRSMQANRSWETKPEVAVRKALWKLGARGYRKNVKNLPGAPDIVFSKSKAAVFVHGCYWHGCPTCMAGRIPKTNSEYWREKLGRNRERDEKNVSALQHLEYRVLTVWECEIKQDPRAVAQRIIAFRDGCSDVSRNPKDKQS